VINDDTSNYLNRPHRYRNWNRKKRDIDTSRKNLPVYDFFAAVIRFGHPSVTRSPPGLADHVPANLRRTFQPERIDTASAALPDDIEFFFGHIHLFFI
jgi:uncharacterized protein (DUF2267 family)